MFDCPNSVLSIFESLSTCSRPPRPCTLPALHIHRYRIHAMDSFDETLTLTALFGAATEPTTPTNAAAASDDSVSGPPVDEDSQANYGSYCVVA